MAGHRVDFAATALAYARSTAEAMGPDVAERMDWVEADLATWTPQRDEYDLVVCLYVHVAGSVEKMVQRMAKGSLAGGPWSWLAIARSTRPPERRRPRPGRCVDAALAALDPDRWELVVAEDRPRPVTDAGVDAVIRARRRS